MPAGLAMMLQLRSRPFRPARIGALALALAGAALLCGCSSSVIVDNLPTAVGGLPQGTPERPATPPLFPAVHDLPRERAASTLSADDFKKIKDDLNAARDRVTNGTDADPDATASARPAGSDRNR